jgi:FixJ family two-component response regulator
MQTLPLIAVVDDDESVRESLPDLLLVLGYGAVAFDSAEAFLASSHLDQTQCIVLDIAMPGMSGPELASELRSRGHLMPIVFITAHREEALRQNVRALSPVVPLIKPFSDTALASAVETALGANRD